MLIDVQQTRRTKVGCGNLPSIDLDLAPSLKAGQRRHLAEFSRKTQLQPSTSPYRDSKTTPLALIRQQPVTLFGANGYRKGREGIVLEKQLPGHDPFLRRHGAVAHDAGMG